MTMRQARFALILVLGFGLFALASPAPALAQASGAGTLTEGAFASDLLPRTMKYGVLLPPGYEDGEERYPVLFQLYPGNADSYRGIARWQQHIRLAWAEGRLPPAIIITPAIDMAMYMDASRSGASWYEAFTGPFLDHLEGAFRLWQDRPAFYATGLSAGGAITLRLGLADPHRFGAIAALAPGIEAAAALDELTFEDTFWRGPAQYAGVDPAAWAAVHPVSIARRNAEAITASGLGIYLETGDEDAFLLHRGTEFMHQTLTDLGIAHEYHLRQGVDHHVGTIMVDRWQAVYAYFGDHMRAEPKEEIVLGLQAAIADLRAQAEKGIPNDPELARLRVPLFGFSRAQAEIEAAELQRRLEAVGP